VDWIGAGFSLVAANVYEQLELPYYENLVVPFDDGKKVLQLSEDLGFSLKLNQAGIPIHVDASIVAEHQYRPAREGLPALLT
jgi:hypothetical protein